MDDFSVSIKDILNESQFNISDAAIEKFIIYARELVDWNEKINLTAITEPKEIAKKHFLDSLLVLQAYDIPYGAKVIDVGTGAGFPGIPLKIMRPDIHLTLLDSLNKRLIFLKDLLNKIDCNADIIHARAEEASRTTEYREQFDIATSRAVAPLNILLEYCMPFVKKDGVFISLKGSNAKIELNDSKNAIKCLNVNVLKIKEFNLIDKNDRNIIIFNKISNISNIYPRHGSKISKKPL